ncbi:MAG: hypothetical protein LC655_01225, partial [Bacteroidales bacterium]|nr:hypothetical protein [Bacteroidales bacterium]
MKRKIIIGGVVVVILAAVGLWIVLSDDAGEPEVVMGEEVFEEIEQPVEYFYGIPVDSFTIEQGIIRRNELLGNILHDHGVSNREVYELSLLPREEFDVRRVKAGNRYALFLDS